MLQRAAVRSVVDPGRCRPAGGSRGSGGRTRCRKPGRHAVARVAGIGQPGPASRWWGAGMLSSPGAPQLSHLPGMRLGEQQRPPRDRLASEPGRHGGGHCASAGPAAARGGLGGGHAVPQRIHGASAGGLACGWSAHQAAHHRNRCGSSECSSACQPAASTSACPANQASTPGGALPALLLRLARVVFFATVTARAPAPASAHAGRPVAGCEHRARWPQQGGACAGRNGRC